MLFSHVSPIRAQSEDDPYLLAAPHLDPVSQQLIGDMADGRQDVWRLIIPDGSVPLISATLSGAEDSGARLQLIAITRDEEQRITSRVDLGDAALLPMLSDQSADMPERMLLPGEYIVGIAPYKAGLGQYEVNFRVETGGAEPAALGAGKLWRLTAGNDETCHDFETEARSRLTLHAPHKAWTPLRLLNRKDDQLLARGEIAPLWRMEGLPAGAYRLCLRGKDTPIAASLVPAPLEFGEQEPNDEHEQAKPLIDNRFLAGDLTRRGANPDRDWIDLGQSGNDFALEIRSDHKAVIDWKLTDGKGTSLKQGSFRGSQKLLPLTGETPLMLQLSANGVTQYTVRRLTLEAARFGAEHEPNDRAGIASPLAMDTVGSGKLPYGDRDFFAVDIPGPAQLWRVQADGLSLRTLKVHSAGGEVFAERQADHASRLRISSLYLTPGPYFIELAGQGRYTLRLLPQGSRLPGSEVEPNAETGSENLLEVGTGRRGILEPGDTDRFRFSLRAPERLRIELDPPFTEPISVRLIGPGGPLWQRELTGGKNRLDYTALFHPGDYLVEMTSKGSQPGLDDYRLMLSPADPFPDALDQEPNDTPDSIIWNWPKDNRLKGNVGGGGGIDLYGLVIDNAPTTLRFCGMPDTVAVAVSAVDGQLRATSENDGDETCNSFTLSSADSYLIAITPTGKARDAGVAVSYDLQPNISSRPPQAVAEPTEDIELSIGQAPPSPRAFLPGQSQHLPITLSLSQTVDAQNPPELTLHSSAPGWRLAGPPAHDSTTNQLHAELVAPPDLPPEQVRLWLRLDWGRNRGKISMTLTPDTQAPAVAPQPDFPLPPALRGGLNLAASALGGQLVDGTGNPLPDNAPGLRMQNALIDGEAPAIETFSFGTEAFESGATVNLAGDDPVPLAGLILTARNGLNKTGTLRDFRVEHSLDGQNFSPLISDQLSPTADEQPFVLKPPVMVKYLRLIPLSAWRMGGRDDGRIHLSELRAVAQPGFVPSNLSEFNLADPRLGGHVVWTRPELDVDGPWDQDLLVGGDDKPDSLRAVSEATIVLGFHHARAARLTALGWEFSAAAEPGSLASPTELSAAISLEGPLGPWLDAGNWQFSPQTPAGHQGRLAFSQPLSARYLRLTIKGGDGTLPLHLPDKVMVWEAPSSKEMPSVLGEWGEFSVSATTGSGAPPISRATGGAAPDAARPLPADVWQGSSVQRGQRDDWWAISVEQAPALVHFDLDTFGRGGVRPELKTPDGAVLDVLRDDKTPGQFTARLETLGTYLLRIYEPRQALVVAYDTSGSTQPYRAQLRRALFDIAEAADPSRDLVGFLPFGGALLGGDLTGNPEELLRRLTSYTDIAESSAAETTLAQAADILASHDGARAVILMTDAATDRDPSLWSRLAAAHPFVVAMAIPASADANSSASRERDLMETWAMIAGGNYDYVSSQGDFSAAFERARARLQVAKPYRLRVMLEAAQPLEPGVLRVELVQENTSESAAPSGNALMILLDNSGSMLKRLDGRPRYQIAQSALETLLSGLQQSRVSVGLRLFGMTPDQCETALVAPPGSPQATLGAINGIRPQNLARTPIAMALEAAAEDLADFDSVKRIVVLSDGEETCDGDPGAIIARLRSEGITTRIDIIGFQIDDPVLSAQFEAWAKAGGGEYWDADGADNLAHALEQAARPAVRVTAHDGEVFTTLIGAPDLSLPPGRYLVEVEGTQEGVEAEIRPGETTIIALTSP